MYTISGPEFSKEIEIIIQTIVISLYGSKKSMARFNGALLDKINIIGFKPSKPDPYLWIRDTGNHHEYISVCYDDLLVFSKNPMGILKYIYTWFTLKVVVRHELYLGGDIKIYNYDTREFHHIKSTRIYTNNVRDKIETLFENNIINY